MLSGTNICPFHTRCFFSYCTEILSGLTISSLSPYFYYPLACTRADYKSDTSILDSLPYSFFHIEGKERKVTSGSYSNAEEALAAIQILKGLRGKAPLKGSEPWHSPDKIRIITFYQGQVSVMRRLLNQHGLGQVLVSTVDSSQGCEADIVIVSFVRSNDNHGSIRRTAGFLADDRRINVALTRARYQLICLGNAHGTLSQSGATTLKAIVDDAKERGLVSLFEFANNRPSALSAKNPARDEDLLIKNKEKQIVLHKKVTSSANTTNLEKKQSMLRIASLQKEIIGIKTHRLVALKSGPDAA